MLLQLIFVIKRATLVLPTWNPPQKSWLSSLFTGVGKPFRHAEERPEGFINLPWPATRGNVKAASADNKTNVRCIVVVMKCGEIICKSQTLSLKIDWVWPGDTRLLYRKATPDKSQAVTSVCNEMLFYRWCSIPIIGDVRSWNSKSINQSITFASYTLIIIVLLFYLHKEWHISNNHYVFNQIFCRLLPSVCDCLGNCVYNNHDTLRFHIWLQALASSSGSSCLCQVIYLRKVKFFQFFLRRWFLD